MTVGLQVPALDRERSSIAAAGLAVGDRQGELDDKVSANATARDQALAPLEQSLQTASSQPMPERRKVEMPEPPKPKAEDFSSFSYGLLAMAMIGGAASKGNWMNVASTLNGAMKGKIEGDQSRTQTEYKNYEREFKSAVEKERQANQEFEDILKQRNTSINSMISQYRVAAAKYDRQDALHAAGQRSIDRMWSAVEQRKSALTKLEEQHERLAPQVNSGGLSERYAADPQYKKNVDYWANYMKQGNTLPARFAQSGAGKVMMPDIINVIPTLGSGNPADMAANKLSLREMTAEAQKIGTQAASVAIANKELMRFIPLAEKAIDDVPRTAWKPLNQLIQGGENTWSPAQKKLVVANRSVQNAFAQLIQRGAPTVHSLSEAEAMLSTADSPAVYKAAMKQLMAEGEQAEHGLNDAREDLLKRARAMGTEPAAPGGAIPEGWSVKEH